MGLGQPVPSAPQPCPGSVSLAQATSGCHHQLQFQALEKAWPFGSLKALTPLPKTPNPALHFALALGSTCPPQKAEPCSDFGGKATAWAGVPGGGFARGRSSVRHEQRVKSCSACGKRARSHPLRWRRPSRVRPGMEAAHPTCLVCTLPRGAGGKEGPFPRCLAPRGTQPLEPEPRHHARRSWGCVDTDGPKSGGLGERERIWLGWAARVLLHAPGRSSGGEM